MPLDPERLDEIRVFLEAETAFSDSKYSVRNAPFEFPDTPGRRGDLAQAAATKPRKGLLRALIVAGTLLATSGAVWEYFEWHQKLKDIKKQVPPTLTVEYLQQYVLHLLTITPETLAQKLFHSMPIFVIIIGFVLLLAALVFHLLKSPAHHADPLLARLLQEKFASKSASSDSYVQSLLADLRFQKIYDRADVTVFPRGNSALEQTNFLKRLLETLNTYNPFVHFIENHPELLTQEVYDGGLQEYLEYGMRQLLFAEALSDPDFAFLSGNTSAMWRGVFHWVRTADPKKILELFPKTDKPSGGTDKKTLAVYLLMAFLLVSLLANQPWLIFSQNKEPKQPAKVEVKVDVHQLVEQLAKLTAKLCLECKPEQPTAPQAPISISIPASPAPSINIPPVVIPSKVEVAFSSDVPPAKTEIQQNVNIPPGDSKGGSPIIDTEGDRNPGPPAGPKPMMQGDTLVPFTRNRQRGKQQPVAAIQAPLVLHGPGGEVCNYTATLLGVGKNWPPDPVQMQVMTTGNLPAGCPQIPAPAIISVSRKPLFNDLLKAYVSIDEQRTRRLRLFGRDLIVVLIHYGAPKFE